MLEDDRWFVLSLLDLVQRLQFQVVFALRLLLSQNLELVILVVMGELLRWIDQVVPLTGGSLLLYSMVHGD